MPELAPAGLHEFVGVDDVVAVPQLIVVYELAEVGDCDVHDPAGVGPEPEVAQVVAVQLLPADAGSLTQLATNVGPVVTVSHVMCPPGVQLPTGPGEHSSVLASQERSCDVLLRTWLVVIWSCDVEIVICDVLCVVLDVLCVVWAVLCSACAVLP